MDHLLRQYLPSGDSYNELLGSGNSGPTPEWGRLLESLQQLGAAELSDRSVEMERLLRDNGVAYNIFNRPDGKTRPWELDPLPQLIEGRQWDFLRKGLAQRAELLSRLLTDLYGPQRLIHQGIIPQELIYMHPGFIRNCVGLPIAEGSRLTLYAADLARSRDGAFRIISDRSQAPSGYGYALENRSVINQVMPELFTRLQVQPITPFFEGLQQTLSRLAPPTDRPPRVVLLSSGPDNDTYFEQSYLSVRLGFTLVSGSDLMVKDQYVWLKTIEGLQQVDVILRRMEDRYCDPLELRGDSLLGTPGLMQALRKGHVTIVNAPGSSLIENPGLMAFLNSAARYLLNEELLLPSIATWWCGQPKEMQYVTEHLDQLIIRRIFRQKSGTRSAINGAVLSKAERQALIREIQAAPYLFAGQEKISFSATPCWADGRLQAGHSLIRSFLLRDGDHYYAMPGGLSRASLDRDHFIISNQTGGISKDTWVTVADAQVTAIGTPAHHAGNFTPIYEKGALPSQTAENLFWSGRYVQRVMHQARLIKTVVQYLLEHNYINDRLQTGTRRILLQALTHCTYTYPGFTEAGNEPLLDEPWPLLLEQLYSDTGTGSLKQNLKAFIRVVHQVRSFLSQETWQVVRQLDIQWDQRAEKARYNHQLMIRDIDQLNTSLYAFIGMSRESSRREREWSVLELGRKFEQFFFTTRLLRYCFASGESEQTEKELISLVLETQQSRITYRYTFRDQLQLPLLLELLVFDPNYPRSLNYILERIRIRIEAMPEPSGNGSKQLLEDLLRQAAAGIHACDARQLADRSGTEGHYQALHRMLEDLDQELSRLQKIFSTIYFKHTAAPVELYGVLPD
ncbi:circularly permuted type 2 ATP-grasp protein [Niabella terrae]